MCLIGIKETYVQEKKKWQKTFWVKFALPYPALIYHGLNDCKYEDNNDGAFVLWWFLFVNTKMVATEYFCRLLQCCDP